MKRRVSRPAPARPDSPRSDRPPAAQPGQPSDSPVVGLRIIGGTLRGRKLQYTGDLRTRPMKDRVREAVFNLLGPGVKDSHAIDLFAGTGALGLEAVSRGAARATLIERHLPTCQLIEQNAAALGIRGQIEVVFSDAFIWARRWLAGMPAAGTESLLRTVFCSPPYEFYDSRREDMLLLIGGMVESAPAGSLFAIEADARFDFGLLPQAGQWDVREYPPAVVGTWRKDPA